MENLDAGSSSIDSPSDRNVFDPEVLLQRVGGDIALRDDVLSLVDGELLRLIAVLEQAVTQKDAERIERTAHTIKGAMSNLGATKATAEALHLEHIGRDRLLEQVEASYLVLKDLVHAVRDAVAKFRASSQ